MKSVLALFGLVFVASEILKRRNKKQEAELIVIDQMGLNTDEVANLSQEGLDLISLEASNLVDNIQAGLTEVADSTSVVTFNPFSGGSAPLGN